jgi:ABC-type transport system involved in multi-copper enzyme maturation permease subunit
VRRIRFSLSRIILIARNTVREAMRQRLLVLLTLIALGLVVGSQFLRQFNFGSSELKFITDLGFGVLTAFGSILAIVVTAQLFFNEVENRTALTILAKPVFRSEFMLGKFAGVAWILLLFCLLTTASLGTVLLWREEALRALFPEAFAGGRIVAYGSLWCFCLLQWVKFSLLAAITLFICSFSNTNMFSVAVGFLVLVICHLQYLAHDAWAREGTLVARVAATAIGLSFPNFQLFNLGDRIGAGQAIPAQLMGSVALYGLVYTAVALGLAVFSFRKREI